MDKVLTGPIGSKLALIIVINNGFISGMAVSWTGASFAKVRSEAVMTMTMTQAAIAVAIFYFGQAVATMPYGYGEKAFGKRRMLQFGITFIVAGWLIIYFSENRYGSYVGRFMLGVWLSTSIMSTTPYLAEVAVPARRGLVVSFVTIQFMAGAILESVMAIYLSYFRLALLNMSVGTFHFISLQLVPESPYFLIRKGRIDDARRRFYWFRGTNSDEFQKTVVTVKEQMSLNSRYIDIFKYPLSRSAFSFALTLIMFQRVSGVLPVYAYAAYIFPDAITKSEYMRILFYCISLICVLISGNTVDRIGRRKLLIISAAGSCIFCMTTTVWFVLSELTSADLGKANWVPLVSITGEIASNALGTLYIPSILVSEMFPVNIKAKAMILLQLSQLFLIILNIKLYMAFKVNHICFVIYTVYTSMLTFSCFYYIKMYDTKGKTLEEIHAHFEAKGRRRTTISIVEPIKNTFAFVKKKEKRKSTIEITT
ncbi:facilitated trehalose transporter Tret1-like [Cimex lectularius]|uniref:Major facilitator superfamily (MFS) profile domain-containing protein n=1 Tax=Cimex lectularius TaxID=79782 RepID=A0A8I6RH73_CIMLE|nr:facilitated trehalose transporter Tret1-like [Cimex lectularius]